MAITEEAFSFIFANNLVAFPEMESKIGRNIAHAPGPFYIPSLPGVYWVLSGNCLPVVSAGNDLFWPDSEQLLQSDPNSFVPKIYVDLTQEGMDSGRSGVKKEAENLLDRISCLYVGRSENIYRRWFQGHHRYKFLSDMAKSGTRLGFGYMVLPEGLGTLQTLETLEKSVMQLLRPWLNDTTVPNLSKYAVEESNVEEPASINR